MSNDPSPGGEQPGWQGHQPYPGSYGQHGEQPGYPGAYAPHGYGQQQPPPWAAPTQQQRPGYPADPHGAGPAGLAQGFPGGAHQTFFGALFDFGFNSFATAAIIKVLYILGMIGILGVYVVYVVLFFTINTGLGLVTLVLGGVFATFLVMLLRAVLEFIFATVRMSEDIHSSRSRP